METGNKAVENKAVENKVENKAENKAVEGEPLSKRSLADLADLAICPYCLKSTVVPDSEYEPNIIIGLNHYHYHCHKTMVSTIKRYQRLGYQISR